MISKPVPTYTDEARALKLEGEVLLEVEFSATGQVHVLRVVRGLGHGTVGPLYSPVIPVPSGEALS